VPLGKIGGRTGEERDALAEPPCGPLGAEHPDPRGRELEGERQPVERTADPGDVAGVRVRQLEPGHGLASALHVEPDGRDRLELGGGGELGRGDGERLDAVLVLEPHP